MSADFISGLLLTAVVLFAVVYVVRVFFGESIKEAVTEHRSAPPAGANRHLIGAVGRVVDAGEQSGEMRVRVGMERWPARLSSPSDAPLPVGTEVEVKAVDGRILEVIEKQTPTA